MNLKNSRFEWICKGEESLSHKLLRIGAQCGCICFGLLAISFMLYIPFLLIAVICGAVWIIFARSRQIEYEFDYLSGDLTIFKISNNYRRKKKFFCTLEDITYIRKGTDENTPTKKYFFHPEEVYTMQVNNSQGKNILLLEADERFLQILDQEHKLRTR